MVQYYCDKCKEKINYNPYRGCFLRWQERTNIYDAATWKSKKYHIAYYCYCEKCHNEFIKPIKSAITIINNRANNDEIELSEYR